MNVKYYRKPSISAACLRVVAVIATPPSMRAISSIRDFWSSTATRLRALPLSVPFATDHCSRACAATCGKCVTHSTWRSSPRARKFLPTTSATAPPIPASTSSKIRVGTAAALLVITWIARLMRDSSPPDATLARARGSVPGLVETRNSTSSLPVTLPSGSSERSSTSKRPPAIASSFIAALTSRPSFVAALPRSAESFPASASYRERAACSCFASASRSAITSRSFSRCPSETSSSGRASGFARKFRAKPEALPELLVSLGQRLKDLEVIADLEALAKQEQAARSRYDALAGKHSAERGKAATKLGREVNAAMKELAMAGGRFEVELRSLLPDGSVTGNELVEFLVSTNPGTEPRALAKVASGGELSRISLAIQVITSKAAAVPTLIFDEVDAGIGGAVAEVVGRNLRALGEERQVLCVTHLPRVAAQAREQWSVAKGAESGSARSRVAVLDAKSRVEEIARMLGGVAITATTRKHAAEMLGLR